MKYIFLMLFSCSFLLSHGQIKDVDKNSAVYPQLKRFIQHGDKSVRIGILRQENLLDTNQTDYGVFRFIEVSSEGRYELYLRDFKKNKITILPCHTLVCVLPEIIKYLKRNTSYTTAEQEYSCILKVVEYLRTRSN